MMNILTTLPVIVKIYFFVRECGRLMHRRIGQGSRDPWEHRVIVVNNYVETGPCISLFPRMNDLVICNSIFIQWQSPLDPFMHH